MKRCAIFGGVTSVVAAGFLLFRLLLPAWAGVSCSLPFTLTNGTTADATQVMANYNAIITCLGNAAAAGANTDITSLGGLTTPIPPAEGGTTVFTGGTSSGGANAQLIPVTIPSNFSLVKGYTIVFVAGFTNTAAMQINVNGTGLVNLFKQTLSGPVAMVGGEVQVNQVVTAVYDGTEFQTNPVPNVAAGFGLILGSSGIQISTTTPPYGFDTAVNLSITTSTASGILTVNALTQTGATPSATNPILIPFINNGAPAWLAVTSALNMTTNAIGATLGTSNNVPFRLWLVAFNNSGTASLALVNCLTSTQIFPLDQTSTPTTVGISAAATNAGTFYTPNGTTLSGKNFIILGYLEWASGLAAAGNYTTGPTKTQLFGPGIKKPGDVLQQVYMTQPSGGSTSSTVFGVAWSQAIVVASAANAVNVYTQAQGQTSSAVSNSGMTFQMFRGSTALGNPEVILQSGAGSTAVSMSVPFTIMDLPGASGSVTYNIEVKANASSGTINYQNATMILQEIMGALEPANDNGLPLSLTG